MSLKSYHATFEVDSKAITIYFSGILNYGHNYLKLIQDI